MAACEQALEAGVRLLQYRNKSANAITRFRQSRELLALCHQYGAKLIINDESTLTKAVGADGVHLGQQDGQVSAARSLLGQDKIIGVSCHGSFELAQKAVAAGVDYVAFGRFFPSQTKPDAAQADISVLTAARSLKVPLVAIGGITPDNASVLLEAGADMLAVVHGIFGQPDIRLAAQSFVDLFETQA
jgi:thiamine-phosphate pyrophosphorylase